MFNLSEISHDYILYLSNNLQISKEEYATLNDLIEVKDFESFASTIKELNLLANEAFAKLLESSKQVEESKKAIRAKLKEQGLI